MNKTRHWHSFLYCHLMQLPHWLKPQTQALLCARMPTQRAQNNAGSSGNKFNKAQFLLQHDVTPSSNVLRWTIKLCHVNTVFLPFYLPCHCCDNFPEYNPVCVYYKPPCNVLESDKPINPSICYSNWTSWSISLSHQHQNNLPPPA